jgi:hypothetical protein
LIGNPYPSAIDWNLDNGWNRTNTGGWAVIYDNATFRVYVELQGNTTGKAGVFDIMGREVCSFRLNNELTKKALYRTGYYIVKVETGNGVTVKKVFIKN